jgi:hypothetical protein
MHPLRTQVLILTLALAFLTSAAIRSQQLVLELPPGVSTLAYCDSAHVVGNCAQVHVETPDAVTTGETVQLNGKLYILDWIGPGYYLDSGVILQAHGKAKARLAGQSWVEVYPERGRVHTSRSWKDVDGNLLLSITDKLTLEDGRVVRIKDVRLNLRVSPVPEP